MRVVVTGATGNVGTALLRQLADEPQVDAIVGIARRRPRTQAPKTTWLEADVARADLRTHLEGADAVVHLAWLIQPSRDEGTTHAVNVEGSGRVFQAAADAGVPTLVHASSVGAYSPGPKDRHVDESWPTEGVASSFYSRHKAAAEKLLDGVEAAHPELRVVRLRPGIVLQREAATEIRRLFLGPFVPGVLAQRGLLPLVPRIDGLRIQVVHADDVAAAYRLAVVDDAMRGAYNVAADPVIDPDVLASLLDARQVPVPRALARAAADLTWRARLQPTPPGWLDMGTQVPLMSTARLRRAGWTPRHAATAALLALLHGLRDGAGHGTPPLDPATSGPLRVRELLTGLGARNP